MDPENMIPIDLEAEAMWTLSEDRTEVRFTLPSIVLEGLPNIWEITLDFDMAAVDAILAQLAAHAVSERPTSTNAAGHQMGRGDTRRYS